MIDLGGFFIDLIPFYTLNIITWLCKYFFKLRLNREVVVMKLRGNFSEKQAMVSQRYRNGLFIKVLGSSNHLGN